MDRILSKAFKIEEVEKLENEINNMVLEIKEKPNKNNKLSNPILEEYAKKYKPEELTDDGVPTIETQLREIKEKDEELKNKHKENEEKRYKREMTQRVKCLSLNKMNKHFMMNTIDLNTKERKKLQQIMWSYNDIDHEKIIEEFNELICEELDNVKELDYSKLPVYDI